MILRRIFSIILLTDCTIVDKFSILKKQGPCLLLRMWTINFINFLINKSKKCVVLFNCIQSKLKMYVPFWRTREPISLTMPPIPFLQCCQVTGRARKSEANRQRHISSCDWKVRQLLLGGVHIRLKIEICNTYCIFFSNNYTVLIPSWAAAAGYFVRGSETYGMGQGIFGVLSQKTFIS